MPALLTGWIDRVFVAGWAFGLDGAGGVVPRRGRLTVHLLPVSGTSERSFARHGSTESLRSQIERGVIGYCGARHGVTAFAHDSESEDRAATAHTVDSAVATVASALA